ncbi:HlyD family type I secretion periplasmic adaptor subunit [Cohaesibacter marisflavi]|uniref:HlyD family type I secretion periplasmic adaptor subunit n=1 Tax=Cohaesibacter marisflavi TaxID=655353 RepID=UPI0029C87AE1|nr:HlyD family type I secretion periplasmic adaptor subunit [Cohaesibacter marisflavi]
MNKSLVKSITKELRVHLVIALILTIIIVGGLGVSSAYSNISSAVIASGSVVVEGNRKRVQHREGGTVKEINVKEGDPVAAGDILIRLDDTSTRANLAIVTKHLAQLRAAEARLIAERDGLEDIDFPEIDPSVMSNSEREDLYKSHRQLLLSKRNALAGNKSQLQEQINQIRTQIDGLQVQRDAKNDEISLIQSDITANVSLLEKQLVTKSRVNTLKREKAELEGEYGAFVSDIAQLKQAISEKKFQIVQLDENYQSSVLEQYHETETKIGQLEQQEIAAREQLRHMEIKAPQDGRVLQLAVHTIGAVISPGETVMIIVPSSDNLVIDAQVSPAQIDRLSPEQQARLRFPAFDRRTTPELAGTLRLISADRIVDSSTGTAYYLVRVTINDGELSRLGGKLLVPGMPVEVYLQTGYRSIMSYLIKPMVDQITHAFKER